jgi:hypothetical protein
MKTRYTGDEEMSRKTDGWLEFDIGLFPAFSLSSEVFGCYIRTKYSIISPRPSLKRRGTNMHAFLIPV